MTTKYANGKIPASALVPVGDGNPQHTTTPYGKYVWDKLVALVKARHGKTLHISPGYCAYRPLDAQVRARKEACDAGNCLLAATPGTSSHGGTWHDKKYTGGKLVDAMAFDVGDWSQISWAQFQKACSDVGLIAGAITQDDEGATEPWHVVLLNPYRAVPKPPVPEDDMPLKYPNAITFVPNQKIDKTPKKLAHTPGKNYVSLVNGPADIIDGTLIINTTVTKPGAKLDATVVVQPVIATVGSDGKETLLSLGAEDVLPSSGTNGHYTPISPIQLKTGQHLQIRVWTTDGMEANLNAATFRGVLKG